MRACVAGAGGFVGHHLVRFLKQEGYWVRGVDTHVPAYEPSTADEFLLLDLREQDACEEAVRDVDEVYQLAATMGGIGFITVFRAEAAWDNVLINTHMLRASLLGGVKRHFFASSACVYPKYRQDEVGVEPLKESDAFPADPEAGYGFEKLFSEQMCAYFLQDYGLETRVARLHNAYGNLTTYEGGREKAPAALCRKIALAKDGDEIEVWGDGKATRSFMYVDDAVKGIYQIMQSSCASPLNLGSSRLVTIDELVGIIAKIAGKEIRIQHNLLKPQGVRGRNSDNTKIKSVLGGWEPTISLEEGLQQTYRWIVGQLAASDRLKH